MSKHVVTITSSCWNSTLLYYAAYSSYKSYRNTRNTYRYFLFSYTSYKPRTCGCSISFI